MIAMVVDNGVIFDPSSPEFCTSARQINGVSDGSFQIYLHDGSNTVLDSANVMFACVLQNAEDNSVTINHAYSIVKFGEVMSVLGYGAMELSGGYGIIVGISLNNYQIMPVNEENRQELNSDDTSGFVLARVKFDEDKWLYTKILDIPYSVTQDLQNSDSDLVFLITEGSGMFYLNDDTFSFERNYVIRVRRGDRYQFETLDDSSVTMILIGVTSYSLI